MKSKCLNFTAFLNLHFIYQRYQCIAMFIMFYSYFELAFFLYFHVSLLFLLFLDFLHTLIASIYFFKFIFNFCLSFCIVHFFFKNYIVLV